MIKKIGMFLYGFIKGFWMMPIVPFLVGICYASDWSRDE